MLKMVRISEGGAIVQAKKPSDLEVSSKFESMTLSCGSVYTLLTLHLVKIRIHSLHGKQAPSFVPLSRNFQSVLFCCPNSNKGPDLD